ncbi:hypothetical protein Hanom_Chr10g00958991 [Helianthus anomalus]
MAHGAKALDFECPSWDINAWERKLKSLSGTSAKPAAEGSSKAIEKPIGAEREVQVDPEMDAVKNVMNEEGAAS